MIIFQAEGITERDNSVEVALNKQIKESDWQSLTPAERILADSDGEAFVYLLENDEGFHHVRITSEHWYTLNDSLDSEKKVYLAVEGETAGKLELTHFWEEIKLLLENIKGNNNYGKEFVNKVEQTFDLKN
ncbi:hypothetical protein [Salipaludibacillus aurantiacus]|uniref:Uncharacterized protein n=1 Tax=Salipaludibacillus aurantiacus TaxID=1601833 RepID=A0A1H9TDS7_9BACI|nr:hypothetical protein [Salipaludibacillus aurantiacus]SER95187.1 hypothetical protein SAMN05518684_105270 [Salipaludibacillus aurantiacus]